MTDPGPLFDALDRAIAEALPEVLADVIGRLEMAKARAWGRLLASNGAARAAAPCPDENLPVEEAARRLGVSRDWLYKQAKRLPFALRIGRRVLFSAKGLERWNRQRQGR